MYNIDNVFFFFRGHKICKVWTYTAQKIKFTIKDFFSKCDQIRRKLRVWSHFLKKSLMEKFIFCAVSIFFKFIQVWMTKGLRICAYVKEE